MGFTELKNELSKNGARLSRCDCLKLSNENEGCFRLFKRQNLFLAFEMLIGGSAGSTHTHEGTTNICTNVQKEQMQHPHARHEQTKLRADQCLIMGLSRN